MKVFPVKHIAEIDNYTIKNEPIVSVDLMERASKVVYEWIEYHLKYSSYTIFAGPGNNGGDGLAIARMLYESGKKVNVILFNPGKLSKDCQTNLERIERKKSISLIVIKDKLPEHFDIEECIIDALFGSGLSKSLTDIPKEIVTVINQSGKPVVSVDIPSGLMGEDNSDTPLDSVVYANYTISLQFPKLAFFFEKNAQFIGQWHVLPIGLHPLIIEQTKTEYTYIEEIWVKEHLLQRKRFSHKGDFGHALIFAGSNGKYGAGILATKACLHSGAGLVTVSTDAIGMSVFQIAVSEAMGEFGEHLPDLSKFNVLAAGPGIGVTPVASEKLLKMIDSATSPMVLDADALNILALNPDWLKKMPPRSVITPHPGEFARLSGKKGNDYEMMFSARDFSAKFNLIVVLKGAHTKVLTPEGDVFINSTGNPGMAKGGSGDVLTGIIVSLIARGYNPVDASVLGVYLHGLAGDMASVELHQEYISASDIISYLCHAFKKIYSL